MSDERMKRMGSLTARKNLGMELPLSTPAAAPDTHSDSVGTKSSLRLVQYPTSPQLIPGEEILHFNHPQHPLFKLNLPDLFTCSGCKEHGSGDRFACPQCDFQLHEFCASAPPSLQAHPLHSQHMLLFYSKPAKGVIVKAKCDVCGKSVKGYSFRCGACGFQMHPCCAMLSPQINYPTHPHPLKLVTSTQALSAAAFSWPPGNNNGNNSSSSTPTTATSNINLGSSIDGGSPCAECRRRRASSSVYRCTVCDFHVHVVCAKNVKNGLWANGIPATEKPRILGTAARLASQVVLEFIGGLMDGIGEGVGEVLVQNIARGGPDTKSSNPRNPSHAKTSASTTMARGRRTS